MRKVALLTLLAAFGFGTVAFAEERAPGKSGETPGHEMQEHGSMPGSPGASGYTRGHNKDADDIRGRETTGSGLRDRDDVKIKGDRDHDRDDIKIKRDRD
jgi:hypothetical protein